jgi:hypothetical protein
VAQFLQRSCHQSIGGEIMDVSGCMGNTIAMKRAYLWKGKEELDGCGHAQRAEDHEEFPGNVFKPGWDEETDGKIERPI